MKTQTFLAIILIAFTSQLFGQGCSKYYPMNEGSMLEYTSYDKKGREDGKMKYEISDVSTNGDKTSATMVMVYEDPKGEEVLRSDYTLNCSDNVVTIDYQSLLSNQMMQQYKDMEMDISGTDIELPNNLEVGQDLRDANVAVKMNMSGINMNMNIETINRKVEKKEAVTTPAGTFDCYVIYSENKTKMMMANQTYPTRLWLAEGVGMIKQETYNKNGKLTHSMMLTSYSE